MDAISYTEHVLRNRALLFESCTDLVKDISALKRSVVPLDVRLASGLNVSEEYALEFSSSMVRLI